jgi:hypothetical protein
VTVAACDKVALVPVTVAR